MAKSNDVEIKLSLNDRITKKINDIKTGFRNLGTSIKQESAKMKSNILSLVNPFTLVVGAIAGLGAAVIGAAKKNAALEKSMINISTLTGQSTEQIKEMEISLRDLAKETGISSNQLADAMYDIVSAIGDANDSMEVLKVATGLANLGITDVKTASDALTTVMNSYNISANEAWRISGALFATQRAGKTTVDQLGGSLGDVLPIANSLGVDLNEVLSAISIITSKGVPTSQAVTMLVSAMSVLSQETGDVNNKLSDYGIEIGTSELRTVGFTSLLQKLSNLSATQLSSALGGNVEALKTFQSLLPNLGDYSNNLDSINNASKDRITLLQEEVKYQQSASVMFARQKAFVAEQEVLSKLNALKRVGIKLEKTSAQLQLEAIAVLKERGLTDEVINNISEEQLLKFQKINEAYKNNTVTIQEYTKALAETASEGANILNQKFGQGQTDIPTNNAPTVSPLAPPPLDITAYISGLDERTEALKSSIELQEQIHKEAQDRMASYEIAKNRETQRKKMEAEAEGRQRLGALQAATQRTINEKSLDAVIDLAIAELQVYLFKLIGIQSIKSVTDFGLSALLIPALLGAGQVAKSALSGITLQEGGIINPNNGGRGQIATIGEAGQAEAVVPLDSYRAGGIGSNQPIMVNLKVDGKKIAEAVFRNERNIRDRGIA